MKLHFICTRAKSIVILVVIALYMIAPKTMSQLSFIKPSQLPQNYNCHYNLFCFVI